MSARTEHQLRRNAWLVWLALAVLTVTDSVLAGAAPSSASRSSWGTSSFLLDVGFTILGFSFPTVGLLIILRQPHNRFGWMLLLLVGLCITVPDVPDIYALIGLVLAPGSLPGAAVAAALTEGAWVLMIGSIGIFVVLLFPDGRLPSPGWRWLPVLGGVTMVLITLVIDLGPGQLTEAPVANLENPMGLESLRVPLLIVLIVVLPLLPACIIASAVALVARFRRSHGIERLQLKWVAEAGAIVALTYLVAMAGELFSEHPFTGPDPTWLSLVQDLTLLSFALLPTAIAIAILRHRLYDIDVVIKRTLVYGTLTVSLAAVYLIVVLALRSLTDSFAGHSDLAVASSTLVVAALFRPMRRRIQTVVDRRFYRRAYDAGRTVDAFSERLRQEVDLEAVSADLRVVVAETMQPTQVSLWLRRGEVR